MQASAGNLLIGLGILVVMAGILAKFGLLGWFGNLPGDIKVKREGFSMFFPITSMILISIVLSGLAAIARRLG